MTATASDDPVMTPSAALAIDWSRFT